MNGNFPFKFWCHKVLPLVYDDSISYYEFLCKIAKLVNDISKHNEEQDIAIANNAEHIDNVETKVDTLSGDVLGIAKRICTEAFTAGKSYFVGDYCVYYPNATDENEMLMKGELYKSKEIQLTVSEFDSSKWDKVSVASELKLLFDILDDLLKSLAKRYYPNTQYNKNDIVFYNNKLWICKEATSASEFDRNKWNEFELNTLVEMIDNVKHNIANEYEGYNGETITYPKYSVVWYNDKLYRADEEVVVDSASVLPPSENLKWGQTTMSALFILNNWTIESTAKDLDYMKISIARNYYGYEEEETQYYSEGTYVWYRGLLYKALKDITVDSPSVLPPDQNSDWTVVYLASDVALLKSHSDFTDDNINRLDRTVSYGFVSIANYYQSYSGAALFYPKGSYVWYSDILYKANADVTVDSASVLPPDQNSSWDTVQLTNEIGSGENEQSHNGIFRGKDLTNIYTIEQMYTMIHDGSFSDLFIGDYFTKSITTDIYTKFMETEFESGVTYYERSGADLNNWTYTETSDTSYDSSKIYYTKLVKTENITLMFAGFDYYYNMGDTALTTHHAVLIPKTNFATSAKMNSTNTTEGGYYNSEMHQTTLPCYAASLKAALNNHLLSHRTILPNAIGASIPSMAGAGLMGASSSWDWETVELQLMNEVQVYDSTVWSSSAYDVGCDNKLLPVFKFINPIQFGRSGYWLRSVVSSPNFASCYNSGYASSNGAARALSVRPLILFG